MLHAPNWASSRGPNSLEIRPVQPCYPVQQASPTRPFKRHSFTHELRRFLFLHSLKQPNPLVLSHNPNTPTMPKLSRPQFSHYLKSATLLCRLPPPENRHDGPPLTNPKTSTNTPHHLLTPNPVSSPPPPQKNLSILLIRRSRNRNSIFFGPFAKSPSILPLYYPNFTSIDTSWKDLSFEEVCLPFFGGQNIVDLH